MDQQFKKTSFFLGRRKLKGGGKETPELVGTAFCISVGLENDEPDKGNNYGTLDYLVTCRHVIDKTKPNEELFVRFNEKGGTFQDVRTTSWTSHPDTDVAICPVEFPKAPEGIDVLSFPISYLKKTQDVWSWGISEGYDVTMVGLFPEFAGKKRIQPVARFGKIALMPDPEEKIRIEVNSAESKDVSAYIVESNTWGGMSGSPILFYHPMNAPRLGTVSAFMYEPYLLGLMHGYHASETQIQFKRDTKTLTMNKGLSVVIPSDYILDLLLSPEMKTQRSEMLEMRKKNDEKSKVTPASIESEDNREFTKQQFESALKKASRKLTVSQSGSKKK